MLEVHGSAGSNPAERTLDGLGEAVSGNTLVSPQSPARPSGGMVDTHALGACSFGSGGSNPSWGIPWLASIAQLVGGACFRSVIVRVRIPLGALDVH